MRETVHVEGFGRECNEACPVRANTYPAAELGRDLGAALRKLKRSLAVCDHCARRDDCWMRQNYSVPIEEALGEAAQAWRQVRPKP